MHIKVLWNIIFPILDIYVRRDVRDKNYKLPIS